jgi:hypothetical protein
VGCHAGFWRAFQYRRSSQSHDATANAAVNAELDSIVEMVRMTEMKA